jgi:hypothetical protein
MSKRYAGDSFRGFKTFQSFKAMMVDISQLSFRASWARFRQRRISLRLKLARPGIQEEGNLDSRVRGNNDPDENTEVPNWLPELALVKCFLEFFAEK